LGLLTRGGAPGYDDYGPWPKMRSMNCCVQRVIDSYGAFRRLVIAGRHPWLAPSAQGFVMVIQRQWIL